MNLPFQFSTKLYNLQCMTCDIYIYVYTSYFSQFGVEYFYNINKSVLESCCTLVVLKRHGWILFVAFSSYEINNLGWTRILFFQDCIKDGVQVLYNILRERYVYIYSYWHKVLTFMGSQRRGAAIAINKMVTQWSQIISHPFFQYRNPTSWR